MTLEYRCSKCGALLETTAADPCIEAAPKMLAALKGVVDCFEREGILGYAVIKKAIEVIAEVEGKT